MIARPSLAALDRIFLLRAGVTLLVLVAVEAARVLYVMGRAPGGDGVAIYLSVLLGGLFTLSSREGVLDDAAGVVAFLLAPVAVVVGVAVLALPFSVGSLDVRLGATVLVVAMAASLALLATTLLMPAATWAAPADGNVLAGVARDVTGLVGTVFRPGAVAAAGFMLGGRLLAG